MTSKTPIKQARMHSKWQGIDPKKLNEYAEFAWAVDTLAQCYGDDVRDCLLNRKVDLTHREVVTLAVAALRYPEAYKYAGHSLRNADTQAVKQFIGSR